MRPPWVGGTEVCHNALGGHNDYKINAQKSLFSKTSGQIVMKHLRLGFIPSVENDDCWMTMTYFKVKF